eukprot:CAMPEP_0194397076 /NCGR_PEP_ID=MMETSP0174-20130528/125343_1 /TAXON_ID=216777 /ORGANISM="Proboscia alata, Strain PI-D3" /LENGTH=1174 /DNA_ID=CAMNT_0039193215 /DNA_START=172 /DNA_END=3697 /DNA_ORIENTATION=+
MNGSIPYLRWIMAAMACVLPNTNRVASAQLRSVSRTRTGYTPSETTFDQPRERQRQRALKDYKRYPTWEPTSEPSSLSPTLQPSTATPTKSPITSHPTSSSPTEAPTAYPTLVPTTFSPTASNQRSIRMEKFATTLLFTETAIVDDDDDDDTVDDTTDDDNSYDLVLFSTLEIVLEEMFTNAFTAFDLSGYPGVSFHSIDLVVNGFSVPTRRLDDIHGGDAHEVMLRVIFKGFVHFSVPVSPSDASIPTRGVIREWQRDVLGMGSTSVVSDLQEEDLGVQVMDVSSVFLVDETSAPTTAPTNNNNVVVVMPTRSDLPVQTDVPTETDGEANNTVELEQEVVGIQNGENEVNEFLYPLIGCGAAAIIILCAIASLLLLRKRKQRKLRHDNARGIVGSMAAKPPPTALPNAAETVTVATMNTNQSLPLNHNNITRGANPHHSRDDDDGLPPLLYTAVSKEVKSSRSPKTTRKKHQKQAKNTTNIHPLYRRNGGATGRARDGKQSVVSDLQEEDLGVQVMDVSSVFLVDETSAPTTAPTNNNNVVVVMPTRSDLPVQTDVPTETDGEANNTVELEQEVVGIQNGENEVNEFLYPLIGCGAAAIIILCAIASLLLLRKRKQRKLRHDERETVGSTAVKPPTTALPNAAETVTVATMNTNQSLPLNHNNITRGANPHHSRDDDDGLPPLLYTAVSKEVKSSRSPKTTRKKHQKQAKNTTNIHPLYRRNGDSQSVVSGVQYTNYSNDEYDDTNTLDGAYSVDAPSILQKSVGHNSAYGDSTITGSLVSGRTPTRRRYLLDDDQSSDDNDTSDNPSFDDDWTFSDVGTDSKSTANGRESTQHITPGMSSLGTTGVTPDSIATDTYGYRDRDSHGNYSGNTRSSGEYSQNSAVHALATEAMQPQRLRGYDRVSIESYQSAAPSRYNSNRYGRNLEEDDFRISHHSLSNEHEEDEGFETTLNAHLPMMEVGVDKTNYTRDEGNDGDSIDRGLTLPISNPQESSFSTVPRTNTTKRDARNTRVPQSISQTQTGNKPIPLSKKNSSFGKNLFKRNRKPRNNTRHTSESSVPFDEAGVSSTPFDEEDTPPNTRYPTIQKHVLGADSQTADPTPTTKRPANVPASKRGGSVRSSKSGTSGRTQKVSNTKQRKNNTNRTADINQTPDEDDLMVLSRLMDERQSNGRYR